MVVRTVLSGRRDAALYGKRDARRYRQIAVFKFRE
jgi:hypothetical protein